MKELEKKDTDIQNLENKEDEINILGILSRLWDKRKFIIKITSYFLAVGLFIAIFSAKEYKAECVFVPQSSSDMQSSSLSSLASLAGINLGSMSSTQSLSPLLYPNILQNIDFQKELMYSKIKFEHLDSAITIIDYYNEPKYQKFNLLSSLVKYSFGLPFTIKRAISKFKNIKETAEIDTNVECENLKFFTDDEYETQKYLLNNISCSINVKEGDINLSVIMPDAKSAAQLTQTVYNLMQQYVTEFKIKKSKEQLKFVNSRYNEAKKEFEIVQLALAEYKDANRILTSSTSKIKLQKLQSEYDIAYVVYKELITQKLQIELQVKEDTPVFSSVVPIRIPNRRIRPNRLLILIIWLLLGGIISSSLVLSYDWLKFKGNNWPKKWVVPEENYFKK
ncbi:MAG: Wzz/FepE/Etk N-terminal domain-containing protein [Bacteroidales bacterium]